MRKTTPLLVVTLLAMAGAAAPASARSACPGAAPATAGGTEVRVAHAVRCLVSAERARHGLRRLPSDRRLRTAARRHAADMVRRRYFGHVSPGGGTLGRRTARAGWRRGAAEVLAWGCRDAGSAASTVARWMASPSHRAALLQPRARRIGVGVRRGGRCAGGVTVVAVVGLP